MGLGKFGFRLFILCTIFTAFVSPVVSPLAAAPITEWTLHKTADGSHPDGNEQQMLWLLNRARTNPPQEGFWLATSDLSDVADDRDYFGVNTPLLRQEFDQYSAKPPAAFDARLYYAAEAHSENLIARNSPNHIGQFEAIAANDFTYTAARGNVFFYATSALNAHAAFNIDWSDGDATGMQPGRGHRLAIMAIDGDYTNVGLAVVAKPDGAPYQGYFCVTGDYCRASTSAANHFNRFLVGTVWEDLNANGMYDPGEGLADVGVAPDQGTYYAVTAHSGGYAIPIKAAGTYEITFSGNAIGGNITRSATVGSQSILLDLCITNEPPPPDDPQEAPSQDTSGTEPPPTSDGDSGSGCFLNTLSEN